VKPKTGRTVYSTESPVRREPAKPMARMTPAVTEPPFKQSPRVRLDRAGRGGKTVTIAGPLMLTRDEAEALLSAWKKLCGSGGSLKAGKTREGAPAFELEIQGDHADRLVAELLKAGYKAKRSGG
jgi:translation initiation factor 1 (eIF-1/SUI1)